MSEEDEIEKLLRLADPGPELPLGGEARIRAAVRPLWQQEVRRRKVRRVVALTFAAAAAVTTAFLLLLPRRAEPPMPPVEVARVELVRGPADETLRNTSVMAGARLHTSPSTRAALRLSGGQSLRLDNDTAVRLLSAQRIVLERGAVYIDSGGAHAKAVEVRTPFGDVRDIGTRFEVRVEKQLLVRVREGSVDVAAGAQHFRLGAGLEARVDNAGRQTGVLDAGAKSWSAAVAPPFLIDGRSVAELLDWSARESGLGIRYADAETERLARSTVLHGSASDLSPLEAVEVILPTAGLEAHADKGALQVHVRR